LLYKKHPCGIYIAGKKWMRIAIPIFQKRISPVFDVAGKLVLVDVENNREFQREEKTLSPCDPLERAKQVIGLGANVLICGAISRPLEIALIAGNIQVISFTCGSVEDVLKAFLSGRLNEHAFLMPGCQGLRRSFHYRHHEKKPS
jgi:predicted Fe-Mo cluster-binding NifX family protein